MEALKRNRAQLITTEVNKFKKFKKMYIIDFVGPNYKTPGEISTKRKIK